VEAELRDRWAEVAGTGRAANAACDSLLARYREPHRHYHGLAHLVRLLRTLDELLVPVPAADPGAVRLAGWYHDAVYDAVAADNEAASARLAARVLPTCGIGPARVDTVCRLVLATAGHDPTQVDEAVLVDADLAVLAADPATYAAYARGVRREYSHLDDAAWREGRAAFLRSFLAKPAIFHTAPMREREPVARANLTAELAGLVGSGPPAGTVEP
jgi:predicted metal-dependent HD superfamily phosphohydrolase